MYDVNQSRNFLTKDEEYRLIAQAQAGDQAAREQLITSNQRLVLKIANRYIGMANSQTIEDLEQWGYIGLMKAIEKFDLTKGCRFSTYATEWVRTYIRRECLMDNHLHISHMDAELKLTAGRTRARLYQRLNREPTAEEIAAELGVPLTELETVIRHCDSLSLDKELPGKDNDMVLDVADDTPESEADVLDVKHVLQVLDTLPERERNVLLMVAGVGYEYPLDRNEIGRRLGVTHERIRQIEKEAIQRVGRRLLQRKYAPEP